MIEKEYAFARLILKLANTIIKNRNRHLKELDLTASQADSLHFFRSHDFASISQLKEHLGIAHQTARGIVCRLEKKGLIQMRKSEADARFQTICLTKKGLSVEKIIQHNGTRTGNKLLKGIRPDEQERFFELLQTALKNIEHESDLGGHYETKDEF